MTRLAFIIGGAQKSGTTSLHRLFRWHRGVQMSSKKETHFFDDETHNWNAPDYSALDAFFPESDGRIRGESTPVTLYWRPAHQRLRTYNPDIKLIFLLRDPVQRAYSHWQMMYFKDEERMPFADAIRTGRERVQDEAEVEDLHRGYSYVERGFYAAQLREILKVFPAQNVHCEIAEDFFADRPAGLKRLSSFLGIAPFRDRLRNTHAHKAKTIDYPSVLTAEDARYLAGLYRDDTAELETMLGRAISWQRS